MLNLLERAAELTHAANSARGDANEEGRAPNHRRWHEGIKFYIPSLKSSRMGFANSNNMLLSLCNPWNKDSWKGPVKDAVRAAGLPDGTTAYAMRHSTITNLVTGGLDLLTVAQVSGTSVAMIEKHYGHVQRAVAAKASATLVL